MNENTVSLIYYYYYYYYYYLIPYLALELYHLKKICNFGQPVFQVILFLRKVVLHYLLSYVFSQLTNQ